MSSPKGDANLVANKISYIKNTIRYIGINKIQEKLDPVATEADFYKSDQRIKIYLLIVIVNDKYKE